MTFWRHMSGVARLGRFGNLEGKPHGGHWRVRLSTAVLGVAAISACGSITMLAASVVNRTGPGIATPNETPAGSANLALSPQSPNAASSLSINHAPRPATDTASERNAPPSPLGRLPARQAMVATQSFLGTTDSSIAWRNEYSGANGDLNAVDGLSRHLAWAAGDGCSLFASNDGYTWSHDSLVPTGCNTSIDLRGVSFPTRAKGDNAYQGTGASLQFIWSRS